MSDYIESFIDGDYRRPTPSFVENEIIPRVIKAIEEFGDGWYDCGEIHTREIDALILYIRGRLKP